jgi:hypothetical protein
MAMTMFDSWFNHMQNVLYRGVSSPRATDLRVVLCNGGGNAPTGRTQSQL